MLTALGPSYGPGFLLHHTDGAGFLRHCIDGAGPLLRRWVPSYTTLTAPGSSNIATTALGPSYGAGFLPTPHRWRRVPPTSHRRRWATPTALGSFDIASTALGSSDITSSCADGGGSLLHCADGAGSLLHRVDGAGSLLHCADGAGSLLHRVDAGSLLHRCVPPTSTVLSDLWVASYGATVHLRIVADRSTWQLVHVRGLRPTRHQWSTNYPPPLPPNPKSRWSGTCTERQQHHPGGKKTWQQADGHQDESHRRSRYVHRTLLLLKCVRLVTFILRISFNIVVFYFIF